MKEFVLLRNGHMRIFLSKPRSLSTRPLKLRLSLNNAAKIRSAEAFYCNCNQRFLNLNYNATFYVTRRFLGTAQTNFDVSNNEPIPVAINTFQDYLQNAKDAVKLKLDQTRNRAIEKDGYIKLRIEDTCGNEIKFCLDRVSWNFSPLNNLFYW